MILKVARLVDVATCLVCVLLGAGAAMVIPLANGFTYTPHAPISIVGNSDFTLANGVTGGSGTNSDPYIIQGWTISCCQSPRILIRDTTANFFVRDIELTGGGSVTLANVANGAVEGLPRSSATSLDLVGDRKILVDNVTGAAMFRVTNSTLVKISRSSGDISISSSNQISVVGNDAESFVVGFRNPFNVVTALRSTQVSISGNRYYTVYLDGSSGVSITDNYLGASCCTTDFTGLRVRNSKHVTVSGNIFNSDTEVASSRSSSLEISDNILENSVTGAVVLDSCSIVSLRDNQILGGVDEYPGIARISGCNNLKISENTFNSPILLFCGVYTCSPRIDTFLKIDNSRNMLITGNTMTNSSTAISISSSSNSLIINNTLLSELNGVVLNNTMNVRVFHNNFLNNTIPAVDTYSTGNVWDNGYPSGGNYWSNYTGTDPDIDGIGDAPYVFNHNQDNYPLMQPFYDPAS